MKNYVIRAALRDEANDGWVWIKDFPARTIVKIANKETKRSVICQTREPDQNFLDGYNADTSRRRIRPELDTIVMSGWYRDALGGFGTTSEDNSTGKVTLDVRPYRRGLWGQLRAASHHPDIVVRLGTRLGALGVWLGLLGAGLGFLSLFQPDGCARIVGAIGFGVLVMLVGALLIGACRSPNISLEEGHG